MPLDDLDFAVQAIDQLESALDSIDAVILDLETGVATAELALRASKGTQAALDVALGTAMQRVEVEVTKLIDKPAQLIKELTFLQGRIDALPGEAAELMESFEDDLNRLLGEVTEMVDGLTGAVEALAEAMQDAVNDVVGKLTGQIDDLFDGFEQQVGKVDEMFGNATESIESIREGSVGSVLNFVERVDQSIGRIASGLEEIEKIVEPVMPVIAVMETVA